MPPDISVTWGEPGSVIAYNALAQRCITFCDVLGLIRCNRLPSDDHDLHDRYPTIHFLASDDEIDIGTARLILRPKLRELPTGSLLGRLEHVPPVIPGVHYSEPSRLGLLPYYVDFRGRALALLRLAGCLADRSMEAGCSHFVISMLPTLMGVLDWFPWDLAEYPLIIPPEEGGPLAPLNIWLGTMSLHDLVAAARMRSSWVYEAMFPGGAPTWYDPKSARSDDELKKLVVANRHLTKNNGQTLQVLRPTDVM